MDVLSLWVESEHTSLFLKHFLLIKLVSDFVWFLSVRIAVLLAKACTGWHQKVQSSLGSWRSTADCSCNVILNVWETSLNFPVHIYDIKGPNAAEKSARFIFIFVLTTFLKETSVLHQLYFFCFLFYVVKNSS